MKRKTTALVTGEGPREEITEIIEGQGFDLVVFEHAEDLLNGQPQDGPCAIVLWDDDAISSLPRVVEPLTRRFAHSPLVVVCRNIDRWGVRAALAAGAAGVTLRDDMSRTLGPCLQAVLTDQTCVPRGNWRQIEPPVLSAREKQILGLVVMGYMNSEIAERLYLAESTVKSHLSSAFGKLGVRSRNEAASLILDPEHGLGTGILGLSGEPVEPVSTVTR